MRLAGVVGGAIVLAFLVAVCEVNNPQACAKPPAESEGGRMLAEGRSSVPFPVLYPCTLPNGESLTNVAVTGERGRQAVTLTFDGPFEMSLRQSEAAPVYSPDPAGTSRSPVSLFPGVSGTLIERYDGSRHAQYQVVWERDDIFYELIAVGPPLQREQVLLVITSLE